MKLQLAFLNIDFLGMIILGLIIMSIIIAFYLCAINKNLKPIEKAIWLLVIWVIPFLGAIAYLANFRRNKNP